MRVRLRVSVVLAVVSSGCGLGLPSFGTGPGDGGSGGSGGGSGTGGSTGSAARFGDGTRLKVRAWSAEGLTGFLGFTDTQLGGPCTFRVAGDGELRCLPGANTTSVGNTFLDAACTQRALLLATCATAPSEVGQYDTSVCPSREHRYPVGAAVTVTTLYQRSQGSCVGAPTSTGVTVYALGAEYPPSRYVKGTVETPSGTSGVGLKVTRGEDGAWQYSGLRDLGQAFEAMTTKLEDGAWHAVPQDVVASAGDLFADSTCTGLAVTRAPSACAAPPWVSQVSTVACEDRRSYAHLGAPQAVAFHQGSTQCVPSDLFSLTAYAVGAPVPASAFATPVVTRQGTGRLQRDQLNWPGGAVTYGPLFDTALGQACQPTTLFGDPRLFCAPTGHLAQVSGFADPGCVTPLLFVGPGDCTPRFAQGVEPAACGSRHRWFAVGAPFTGVAYTGTALSCYRADTSLPGTWFTQGAELTGSGMVELPPGP